MGLSNSQREILLNNINRNNYDNDMVPVSEQIVFSSTDVIHERTIEETKGVKVKHKNKNNKELIVDKIEEYTLSLSEDELQSEIEDIRRSYSDLGESIENDVKYIDYSKVNDELPPSPDISEEQIDIPIPLLTKPELTKEDEEYIDDEVEEIMEYDSKETVKEPVDKEPDDKPPIKPVDKPPVKNDDLDTDFFMAMTNIESKKEDVKQTHKSNSPPVTEQPGGGANIKKIQLTEKYDFF